MAVQVHVEPLFSAIVSFLLLLSGLFSDCPSSANVSQHCRYVDFMLTKKQNRFCGLMRNHKMMFYNISMRGQDQYGNYINTYFQWFQAFLKEIKRAKQMKRNTCNSDTRLDNKCTFGACCLLIIIRNEKESLQKVKHFYKVNFIPLKTTILHNSTVKAHNFVWL